MREHKQDTPADRLPARLPAVPRRERVHTTTFAGLCVKGNVPYGIANMVNMSPRCAPALAVRRPREVLAAHRNRFSPHGLAVLDGALYFFRNGELCRIPGGIAGIREEVSVETVGYLADSDKSMAVLGNRLYILPDKQYVDAVDGALHPMELDSGEISDVEFQGNTVTLPTGMSWSALGFFAGDSLSVINADDDTPAPEGEYIIKSVHGRVATLWTAFQAAYTSRARLLRRIPDMDGVCVSGNRMYGFRGKTVYISGEGSALSFSGARSDGGGPATLRADTEGNITACAPWQGYMVFLKSDRICRLLGSRSDNFALGELLAPGVPAHMARTLCAVGGDLYYHADTGVYRLGYGQIYPERLGNLPISTPATGCGGTDGVGYYISLSTQDEGGTPTARSYLYMPPEDAFYAEDDLEASYMTYMEGFLCVQDSDGRLYICRSDGQKLGGRPSEVELRENYESTVTFVPDHRYEPDGYRPVELYLRATGAPDGELRVLASFAEGAMCRDADLTAADPAATVEVARFEGGMTDRLLRIPLVAPRCDSMVLRLEMMGDWVISSITRVYEVRDM